MKIERWRMMCWFYIPTPFIIVGSLMNPFKFCPGDSWRSTHFALKKNPQFSKAIGQFMHDRWSSMSATCLWSFTLRSLELEQASRHWTTDFPEIFLRMTCKCFLFLKRNEANFPQTNWYESKGGLMTVTIMDPIDPSSGISRWLFLQCRSQPSKELTLRCARLMASLSKTRTFPDKRKKTLKEDVFKAIHFHFFASESYVIYDIWYE